MSEPLIDLQPSLQARKQHALASLKEAKQELEAAQSKYETALWNARALGIANTKIAKVVGLTEAAIRMYFKRSGK